MGEARAFGVGEPGCARGDFVDCGVLEGVQFGCGEVEGVLFKEDETVEWGEEVGVRGGKRRKRCEKDSWKLEAVGDGEEGEVLVES